MAHILTGNFKSVVINLFGVFRPLVPRSSNSYGCSSTINLCWYNTPKSPATFPINRSLIFKKQQLHNVLEFIFWALYQDKV